MLDSSDYTGIVHLLILRIIYSFCPEKERMYGMLNRYVVYNLIENINHVA